MFHIVAAQRVKMYLNILDFLYTCNLIFIGYGSLLYTRIKIAL